MDIKSEVKNLAGYARAQEEARATGDRDDEQLYWQLVRDTIEGISHWADMAKAALAYAEYQYVTDHGEMIEMGDYIGKRGQLWHRFVKAREKAMT